MTLIQQSNTDPIDADPVQRLLEAIAGGAGMPDGLSVGDATLDVPMGRSRTGHAPAIEAEFA